MLGLLLDGPATGYELAKRFDASVANFWHALPQQLYQELSRLEDEGLVAGETVLQTSRPNKRVYGITDAGRDALASWIETPARIRSTKDDLLVKVYASDLRESEQIIRQLEESIAVREDKLAHYEGLRDLMFHGRTEEEFLATTHRAGPYLALKRGLSFERNCIDWAHWAIAALREREARGRRRRSGTGAGATR
jgi:DNA-binding PadR family transcriptional regulator